MRMPPARKRQLRTLADQTGQSMADYVTDLIAGRWNERGARARRDLVGDMRDDLLEVVESLKLAREKVDGIIPDTHLRENIQKVSELRVRCIEAYDK